MVLLGGGNCWATSKKCGRDRDWLGTASSACRAVFGICFGAELLAACLTGVTSGRALARHPNDERVGEIAEIAVRGEGLADSVVKPLRRSPQAVMSREDSFQQPTGEVGLAWSADAASERCEAFRVAWPEDALYWLQFHRKPTLEMLPNDKWLDPVLDVNQVPDVVNTGREVLNAWVKLSISR